MPHRYSTALSHLVLAGTGIFCYSKYNCGALSLPCATYAIIITNSVLGIWLWGNPDHGHHVARPYYFTGFLQNILALPLIVTHVWLGYGMQKELAYVHGLAPILPFILYLSDRSNSDLIDTIIGLNCISLGLISFAHENYFGVAAAVSYLFNHFWLREGNWSFEDLPVLDLFNYGLCFFCYFALRSLGGSAAV